MAGVTPILNAVLSRLKSPMALIGLIAFVDALGFAITLPVFPLYAKDELAASATQITGVQIGLSATALLIVVGVAVDTMRQLEAQLIMRNYEGIISR